MPKIKPFNLHTNDYDRWFINNQYAYLSELAAVNAALPRTGDGIEIGVGSGRFAQPLNIKYGVEPSQKMAELAQQRGVRLIRAIAENLPIKNQSFDFAIMVTTICFLDNVEMAFHEVFRILKPAGTFLIGFVDRQSPIGIAYQKHKKENVFYQWAEFFSVEELVELLRKTGFGNFFYFQTLFTDLNEIKNINPILEGYGKGSFVVIRANVMLDD